MQRISLHSCTAPALSIAANMLCMEQVEADHRLVKALVDWAGGKVSPVAREIGVAASTLNRHYNGSSTTELGRRTLDRLRDRYPDFPGWEKLNGPGIGGNNRVKSEVANYGERPLEEMFGSGELRLIPVVGSAIGVRSFDPERHIELTEVDASDVLDHVRRPASVAGDSRAYALTVVGDSMWPRFRPGRRVIVSPRAPVAIGDDVIVQLKGDETQTATNRDRVTSVLIKELVRRSGSYIELRQFNPDVTFKVPTEQIAAVHKVVGEAF